MQVAQYSDPAVDRWIADCLIERRNRIGRTYFAKVLPLDDIAVRGTELTFVDLAAQYKFAEPRRHRVDWSMYDNKAGKPSTLLSTTEGHQIPTEASGAPAGSYVLARITMEGTSPGTAVNVVLRRETSGLRVVGIDREWPGRLLVDPRIVARPVRNRYVELDADRQRLFDTYARELNVKLGENLSPEERFRALSVSEQTTFDAVTHALLQSTLTDEARQPLGRALDLVTGLDRIAGEQSGRGTDQQFRIYVTLRPDARDVLERSREFVRSHENTVYHVGYPHSYRHASGMPSIQFSLAEDGLSADIDVDYRGSKAPQSLFNGHLTSSNSDVRSGDNSERHTRRWSGFANWWSDVFGGVKFGDDAGATDGPFGGMPTRPPSTVPPNRPAGALDSGRRGRRTGVPDRLADPAQLPGSGCVLRAGRPAVRRRFDGHESQGLAGAPAAGQPGAAGESRKSVGTADQPDPGNESRCPMVACGADREARVRSGLHDRRGAHGARRPVRVRSDAAEEIRAFHGRRSTAPTTAPCCRSSVKGGRAAPSCWSGVG